MENTPKIGVLIGRFQPLHNNHVAAIRKALEDVDHLIIVLGSGCQAKTIANPWTTDERREFIYSACGNFVGISGFPAIIETREVRDYLYNNDKWLAELQSALSAIEIKPQEFKDLKDCDVTLYGSIKDKQYLSYFPQWKFKEVRGVDSVDAERVRECFFRKDTLDLKEACPHSVFKLLKEEIDKNTDGYQKLHEEFRQINNYKEQWRGAPFPPTFVTVDAIVKKSGHVLICRRNIYPGKGLLCLPGGFLKGSESLIESCLRELKEESRIKIPKDELRKRIIKEKVFDHPLRSTRGRTITHGFYFDLGTGSLPKVHGETDVDKAFWMPLNEVSERADEFFEDHWHIIDYFVSA